MRVIPPDGNSADHGDAARPRVSVIIPTRDRPQFLREAIASVRAQTVADHEIVVVVNGPANAYTSQILDVAAGQRIVRIEQAGIAIALNAGIEAARGEWLAFLDDDDLWEPNRLEAALKTADETNAGLIFCDIVMFDENGGLPAPRLRPPAGISTREALTIKNYSGCSSAFVRRAATLAVGGFDTMLTSPDWDLWMRLAWRFPVAWMDAHLAWVRHHPKNTSRSLSWVFMTLSIQRKALRTLPRDLAYMRPRVLWEMIKVVSKGTESHVRRKWLRRVKRAKPAQKGSLKPPTERWVTKAEAP